ncbi:hypothetical protein PHLGIDRAFT_379158 [Phlebiopsis gigantea 11061_1 CR5-6]|uniref:Uncharacterized protein n=1 Tax=Phlebiopsis gigantea (strain 11061_1 CR5-6) TaxID=745531 RepID=A0A0C3SC40_PHLG1|nr:hypothetical protein PHLGIDRAFT_379158 [Phlebiopsis gigantea 11061_1 CR5-6]
MDILTKFNYNVIFGPPEEKPRSALKDDGFWRRVHNVTDFLAVRRYGESAIWIDRSQHVSMASAYQAFALSEHALDEILRTKWLNEGYNVWDQEAFKATFSSFSIRLLSTDHLIIVVEIEQAEIISGHAHSKQRPGKGPPLRIFQARRGYSAAELQARIEEEQRESYNGTMVFEVGFEFNRLADEERPEAIEFELSLSHAEYIESLSSLQDYKTGLKASESAQATVRRFMQQYFNEIHTQKRLTVGAVLSRTATQNFAFRTICEREVKIENFLTTRSEASDSSIIVIDSRHPDHPAPSFPWSPGWLPSRMFGGVGTVWIAREEFLQKLLDTLEIFNARTTIVRGTDETFTTFHTRHTSNGGTERTHWQRESTGDLANEYMEYNWHYTYDANRREGTLLTQDLESLLLRTQNHVWVPTESSSKTNQVELALTGEHHTEAAKKQKYGHQLLKKDTTIWWELILTIMSTIQDGLRIAVSHENNVNVDGDDVEDTVNAESLLNMEVITKELEDELRHQLEGPWVYNWFDLDPEEYEFTNPIFTRSGDLVFEIYRKGSMGKTDSDRISNTLLIARTRANVGRGPPHGSWRRSTSKCFYVELRCTICNAHGVCYFDNKANVLVLYYHSICNSRYYNAQALSTKNAACLCNTTLATYPRVLLPFICHDSFVRDGGDLKSDDICTGTFAILIFIFPYLGACDVT